MILSALSRACRAGALVALAFSSGSVSAQDSESLPAPESAPSLGPGYEVVIGNRKVAVLRGKLLGYTPEQRAGGAVKRIRSILEKEGPGEVTISVVPQGRGFAIDGEFAFFLTPHDVDPLAGESLDSVAAQAKQWLELVVSEHIEQRDPRAFAFSVIYASVATFIFVVLLVGIVTANQQLRLKISSLLVSRARGVKIAGVHAIDFGLFLRGVRHLVSGLSWAFGAIITYAWLVFVFERFPYTRAWGDSLLEGLLSRIKEVLVAIASSVPGILTVIVIYFLARWLSQLSSAFFSRVEAGRVTMGWLDSDTATPTRRIVNVVVWLFALAMAYPYLPGSGTDAFKGLSVLVGLMISIGASNLVGQAASGLILMYARSFRVGEFVRIGETEGTVSELGLFSTRVRTGMGEEVMLPNSHVLAQSARNYSRASSEAGFIVSTKVSIGYSTPWRQVHAMLLEAAKRTSGIVSDPEPRVYQTALTDFYIDYLMVCHADPEAPEQRAEMLSALHANIQDTFNEHDVQIMSPHYIADPPERQVVPKVKWFTAPADPPADGERAG